MITFGAYDNSVDVYVNYLYEDSSGNITQLRNAKDYLDENKLGKLTELTHFTSNYSDSAESIYVQKFNMNANGTDIGSIMLRDEVKDNIYINGKDYKYKGYKTVEGSTLLDAQNNATNFPPSIQTGLGKDINSSNENKAIIISFYFTYVGDDDDDTDISDKISKQVFVGHVEDKGNTTKGSINLSELKSYKLDAMSETVNNGTTNLTGNNDDDFLTKYNFDGTVSVEPQINDGYTCTGYKIYKANSYFVAACGIKNAIFKPYYSAINNISDRSTIIIFFYKEGDGVDPPENTDFYVSGNLDYINTGEFENATYVNNGNDSISPSNNQAIDYIPASEKISPYIYGAQPYFIKAIKYEKETVAINTTKTINYETRYWIESENEETGEDTSHYSEYENKTLKINFSVSVDYYVVKELVMYKISEVKISDVDDNTGGKLFKDSSDTITLTLSSDYDDRFGGIKQTEPSIDFTCDNSYTYDIDSPDDSPAEGTVISNANAKYTVVAENDQLYLDGYNILKTKVNKEEGVEVSNTNVTISLDCTSGVDYLSGIDSYMNGTAKLTTYEDFDYEANLQTLSEYTENGIRELTGTIKYEQITSGDCYKKTDDSFNPDKYLVAGETSNTVVANTESKTINRNDISDTIESEYRNVGNDKSRVRRVNVFTPLALESAKKMFETTSAVNLSNQDSLVLQTGAEFTIKPQVTEYTGVGYNNVDTSKYVKGYFVTMDFECEYTGEDGTGIKVYNKGTELYDNLTNGTTISKNTDIYIPKGKTFKGKSLQVSSDVAVAQMHNNIKIVAVTNSIDNMLLDDVFESNGNKIRTNSWKWSDTTRYINRISTLGNFLSYSNDYIDGASSTSQKAIEKTAQVEDNLLDKDDLLGAANHAVSMTISTNNVPRLFGFTVTDCTDLAYQSVFRKNDSNNSVNEPSGIEYYSGTKYWDYNSFVSFNDMIEDSSRTTLLPLGPYKNTDTTYIFAPKLGYRISYKVKTSGYIQSSSNRTVNIAPSYYYIGKDGTGYTENIKLYYKNSSGKYVPFENSGYSIYYKANDGYRYISDLTYDISDTSALSTKLIKLNISSASGVDLSKDNGAMATGNDNYIQAWYGEFKLPNSTIAVEVDGNDINNPLTDGYIGVIFDITCTDKGTGSDIVVKYSNSDQSASSSTNTSQWDYEGYLGFNSPGSTASGLSLQLEKGTWNIDNDTYNKIKGTVILYDTDARAANDFN